MPRKISKTVQSMTRFPHAVHKQLKTAAAKNKTSMNSEIVSRLEQSFEIADTQKIIRRISSDAVRKTLKEVHQDVRDVADDAAEKVLSKLDIDSPHFQNLKNSMFKELETSNRYLESLNKDVVRLMLSLQGISRSA